MKILPLKREAFEWNSSASKVGTKVGSEFQNPACAGLTDLIYKQLHNLPTAPRSVHRLTIYPQLQVLSTVPRSTHTSKFYPQIQTLSTIHRFFCNNVSFHASTILSVTTTGHQSALSLSFLLSPPLVSCRCDKYRYEYAFRPAPLSSREISHTVEEREGEEGERKALFFFSDFLSSLLCESGIYCV